MVRGPLQTSGPEQKSFSGQSNESVLGGIRTSKENHPKVDDWGCVVDPIFKGERVRHKF